MGCCQLFLCAVVRVGRPPLWEDGLVQRVVASIGWLPKEWTGTKPPPRLHCQMLGLMRLAPKGVGGYQAPTTAALQRMLQLVDGIIGPCSGMGGLLRVLDPALATPHLLSGDSAEVSWVVWAIAGAVISPRSRACSLRNR